MDDAPREVSELSFKPLYEQVRERLLGRLIDGTWRPGMALPSEQQLASEMRVSQGTMRKALDALAEENLLVRLQGRGTFVAVAEDGRMLFQFYRLTPDKGTRQFPDSRVLKLDSALASAPARAALGLAQGARVWRIDRTRKMGMRTIILERIVLSQARFPGLDTLGPLPNNVYGLYAARFGITIGQADERLKAAVADARDCKALSCARGTPLLMIDRLAYGLDGVSRCLTDELHYASKLK
jgi:GntR family transcriptional regulator